VAGSPSLYPLLVDAGGVKLLLGLLRHDNTDIAMEVVGALQELTDEGEGPRGPRGGGGACRTVGGWGAGEGGVGAKKQGSGPRRATGGIG
jgi:hypothetical protein